jgi:hypothetical protein
MDIIYVYRFVIKLLNVVYISVMIFATSILVNLAEYIQENHYFALVESPKLIPLYNVDKYNQLVMETVKKYMPAGINVH